MNEKSNSTPKSQENPLVYAYIARDDKGKLVNEGYVKIGYTSGDDHSNDYHSALEGAKEQTSELGVKPIILGVWSACDTHGDTFTDEDVRSLLREQGCMQLRMEKDKTEWFGCSLIDVCLAVTELKLGTKYEHDISESPQAREAYEEREKLLIKDESRIKGANYIEHQTESFKDRRLTNAITRAFNYVIETEENQGPALLSLILFVAIKELGYNPKICYGLCETKGYKEFYSMWIELNGKVIDVSTYGLLNFATFGCSSDRSALKTFYPIVLENYNDSYVEYGKFYFDSDFLYSTIAKMEVWTIKEYFQGAPDVIFKTLAYIMDVSIPKAQSIINKYGDTMIFDHKVELEKQNGAKFKINFTGKPSLTLEQWAHAVELEAMEKYLRGEISLDRCNEITARLHCFLAEKAQVDAFNCG